MFIMCLNLTNKMKRRIKNEYQKQDSCYGKKDDFLKR